MGQSCSLTLQKFVSAKIASSPGKLGATPTLENFQRPKKNKLFIVSSYIYGVCICQKRGFTKH